jgi:hypothetical protein
LAAARAPTPSARPKRTESIPLSVAVQPASAKMLKSPAPSNAIAASLHPTPGKEAGGIHEKSSLDGVRALCRCCGSRYVGAQKKRPGAGSCPSPGAGLVRSPHGRLVGESLAGSGPKPSLPPLVKNESRRIQPHCGALRDGRILVMKLVRSTRNAVPAGLLQPGIPDARSVVYRAARRWH